MGLNCGCPAGAHLDDLEIVDCKESLGQVQKVIIQRIYKSSGEKNSVKLEELKVKATMAANFAAADGTKMIITPYIQNPTTTPGEARTFGGGNQTLGGVEIVIGREPTTFTGVIYQESQATIKTMKNYSCENIGIYLIDENGNVGALSTDGGKTLMPIPIGKFFVGDKNLGGYEDIDSNSIQWSFYPNWSDDLVIIQSQDFDYNPLSDLVNAKSV